MCSDNNEERTSKYRAAYAAVLLATYGVEEGFISKVQHDENVRKDNTVTQYSCEKCWYLSTQLPVEIAMLP